MEVKEFYLIEVALNGLDDQMQAMFSYALKQVFSPTYIKKIENLISQNISIKEVTKDNENIVAYQSGNTIYVNKPVFYTKTNEQKIRYLLHEFFHIMQTSKKMFFSQNFKELNEVSKELFKIVNGNLIKSLSVFLTGKEMKLPSSGQEEILPYFANDKIDWSAITPRGRIAFIKTMANSGLFNMKSRFWTKRLY